MCDWTCHNCALLGEMIMNERIRLLALQAGATVMERSGWTDYGTLDLDVEKFAELIVRECAQKLENDGMVEVAMEIKQHFGVE